MGRKIDALKVVVTKVGGDRDDLKGKVEMMKRKRTALCGRRDDISRDGEGNMADIAGLILLLEEAENRCSRLTDKAEVLRFDLSTRGGG